MDDMNALLGGLHAERRARQPVPPVEAPAPVEPPAPVVEAPAQDVAPDEPPPAPADADDGSVRDPDAVVVEHGTLPVDGLYKALQSRARNRGELDFDALLAVPSRPQRLHRNADGRFDLFRVGDAVSSRNIHAALYDSLRICKTL